MNDAISMLVVDDEEQILSSIEEYFSDLSITTFSRSSKALEALKNEYYDIVIVDYKMPEMNGLELMIEAKKHRCYGLGILLTAYADKSLLEDFVNQSLVSRIVEKPLRLKTLKKIVDTLIEEYRLQKERERQFTLIQTQFENLKLELQTTIHQVIGYNKGLKDIFNKIEYVKDAPVSVCITGETGTGKELIARAIHLTGARKDQPFIKVNCAAVPDNLFESELFGVKKGAFTGADRDRPGKIELAHKGTLFLDEIGEMKLDLQAKLLRAIQTREVERVGDTSSRTIDFRLITATNRSLEKEVDAGRFRMDLYYRINEFPIFLPPLRARTEDIGDLTLFFIDKFSTELGLINKPEVLPETIERLKEYAWKGNVRELENALKRVIIMLQDQTIITPVHLDFLFVNQQTEDTRHDHHSVLKYLADNVIDKKLDIKKLEKEVLAKIVELSDNSVSKAVKRTGIDRNKFYRSL